ncbi:MAG: VWA domain-containing protein [Polyangiaceae bacterium]|nr:VWA domain-containing protein [Polyangiaceae bacterium]
MLRPSTPLVLAAALLIVGCRTLDTDSEPPPESGDDGAGGSTSTQEPGFGGGPGLGVGGGSGDTPSGSSADPVSLEAFDGLGDICQNGPTVSELETVRATPSAFGGLVSVPYVKAALAAGQAPDPVRVSLDEFFTYYVDRLDHDDGATLDVRAALTPTSDVQASLLVTARPRALEMRPTVHVIALTDVSQSTGGSVAVRDGILDGLAQAMDATIGDSLSVVAFGDTPALVLDRAPSPQVTESLVAAKSALEPQAGSDLIAALSFAGTLASPGEPTHVVVLTDGGTLFDDSVRAAAEKNSEAGIITSIVQIGRDVQPDAPVFLNDELLSGVAGAGRGVPVFLPASTVGQVDVRSDFAQRYEAIFPVLSSGVLLTVTLPAHLRHEVPDADAQPAPAAVGFRSVGATLALKSDCDGALGLPLEGAALQATLVDSVSGSTLAGPTLVTLESALAGVSYGAKIALVLPDVVRALRTQQPADINAARDALVEISPDGNTCAEPSPECDLGDVCCARADLIAIIDALTCVNQGGCD